MSQFADNLTLLMTTRRLGSIRLSAIVGIDERRLRRLAEGATRPTLEDVPRRARALRCPPEALAWMPSAEFRLLLRPSPLAGLVICG